jgi:hypothetical protein
MLITVMQKEPSTKRENWSNVVSGVAGRLRIAFEDLNPGLRHAVYLELANHGFEPITLTNLPMIDAEVFESVGKPVGTAGQIGSGPEPVRQWAVIPRDAYVGLRIDAQTIGVPTREHGVVLLAVGGKAWELPPGKYLLRTSATFNAEHDGPPNQWVGKLDLPDVEVVVTPEMVAT